MQLSLVLQYTTIIMFWLYVSVTSLFLCYVSICSFSSSLRSLYPLSLYVQNVICAVSVLPKMLPVTTLNTYYFYTVVALSKQLHINVVICWRPYANIIILTVRMKKSRPGLIVPNEPILLQWLKQ